MAIISSRPAEMADAESQQFRRDLQQVIQHYADKAVGTNVVRVSDDPAELLDYLSQILTGYEDATRRMVSRFQQLQLTFAIMEVELHQAAHTIQQLSNAPFDNALDLAAVELIDVLTASGFADATPDGGVVFDARRTVGKGDLKPALREAIGKWISERLA